MPPRAQRAFRAAPHSGPGRPSRERLSHLGTVPHLAQRPHNDYVWGACPQQHRRAVVSHDEAGLETELGLGLAEAAVVAGMARHGGAKHHRGLKTISDRRRNHGIAFIPARLP